MKCLILGTGLSGRAVADLLERKGYVVEFAKREDIKDRKSVV